MSFVSDVRGLSFGFSTVTWHPSESTGSELSSISNANEVIEKFEIEGVPLINLIDELEEYEPF